MASIKTLGSIPAVSELDDRPERPGKYADKGRDCAHSRDCVRKRGITVRTTARASREKVLSAIFGWSIGNALGLSPLANCVSVASADVHIALLSLVMPSSAHAS